MERNPVSKKKKNGQSGYFSATQGVKGYSLTEIIILQNLRISGIGTVRYGTT